MKKKVFLRHVLLKVEIDFANGFASGAKLSFVYKLKMIDLSLAKKYST